MTSAPKKPLPPKLTSKQASYLRGLAHSLDPVVRLGKGGITDGALAEVARAVEAHELIKVRLEREADIETSDLTEAVQSIGATVVGHVGRVFILYRRHPKKPKIDLPRPQKASAP